MKICSTYNDCLFLIVEEKLVSLELKKKIQEVRNEPISSPELLLKLVGLIVLVAGYGGNSYGEHGFYIGANLSRGLLFCYL